LPALSLFDVAAESAGMDYSLRSEGHSVSLAELHPSDIWELSIGKEKLIPILGIVSTSDEKVLLFFLVEVFEAWADRQTSLPEAYSWPGKLTIYVDGIGGGLSGPFLRCVDFFDEIIDFDSGTILRFPDDKDLSRIVYLSKNVLPRGIGKSLITTGDAANKSFKPLLRWAERDASVLLCEEVVTRSGQTIALLRGSKRAELVVERSFEPPAWEYLQLLQSAVSWSFSDYSEAQHALLLARLALDANNGESLFVFLRRELSQALEVARQQFRVTVVERKDQSVKEQRELIKDIRSQADIFSSKVRELASAFLRDVLAAVLLIGLGLIARLSVETLDKLMSSLPVDAFFKGLSVYFAVSFIFQFSIHWRDLFLTSRELRRWWSLSRSQLPGSEVEAIVEEVIRPRWVTFFITALVILVLNLVVCMGLLNWKHVVTLLG